MGRAQRRFDARRFDIVVLDPPGWSTGPFGAVDLVRDYPSLLKPALLTTASGGALLVTNNVPRVHLSDWLEVLRRTAEKCGRELRDVQTIAPEEDFPSFDDQPPLKMAWLELV